MSNFLDQSVCGGIALISSLYLRPSGFRVTSQRNIFGGVTSGCSSSFLGIESTASKWNSTVLRKNNLSLERGSKVSFHMVFSHMVQFFALSWWTFFLKIIVPQIRTSWPNGSFSWSKEMLSTSTQID